MLTPWFLKDGLGKGSVGPSGRKEREQTLVVSGITKIISKENGRHYIKGKGTVIQKPTEGKMTRIFFLSGGQKFERGRLVF